MDIDKSGRDTLMAHECLDGHKISTIFIKMGPESVAESMAGDPFGPAKLFFVIMDMSGDKESIDRAGRVCLFGKEQTGRIHEGGHSFDFDVRDGLNKSPGFFLRRDIREVSVKLSHGELSWIPGLMENIHGEEADLRDSTVDGTVR